MRTRKTDNLKNQRLDRSNIGHFDRMFFHRWVELSSDGQNVTDHEDLLINYTLVNVYVDVLVFTHIAGTS